MSLTILPVPIVLAFRSEVHLAKSVLKIIKPFSFVFILMSLFLFLGPGISPVALSNALKVVTNKSITIWVSGGAFTSVIP